MADSPQTATPAAVPVDQINQAVAAALAAQLPGAMKGLTDQITAAVQPLADQVATLAAREATAAVKNARAAFLAEKCGQLPGAYQAGIPETDDPAKLQEAAVKAFATYNADLKKVNAPAVNIGGAATTSGGATVTAASAAVDLSKLNPQQLMEMGLKESQPSRGPVTVVTPPIADAAVTK